MPSRLERLQRLVAEAGADVLLVSQPENRRYLTGFTGSAGTVLVTPDQAWLVADFRYWEQAEAQAPDFPLIRLEPMTRFEHLLPRLVKERGWRRIGVEASHVTVAAFDGMGEALKDAPVELVKTKGLVERLREVKDSGELEQIQAALALTDQAMAHAATLLRPGVREAEVAWAVEVFMRTHGAEGLAFPTIVGSGPNAALPHHRSSERELQPGDAVVIDMGAKVDGYCGDLTRTFCLPPVDSRFQELYAIVLEAQQTAERQLRAGMTGKDGDAIARAVIDGRGYGEYFGHSLGHSIGLDIHEAPGLSRLNEEALPAGCVETVEPGIYLPGWGGVRIEDVVVLEEGGARILTGAPK